LKIDISPYLSKKSSDFHEILYTKAYVELDERHVIKNKNFQNSRWRTAAILKIVISPYLSEQEAQLSQRDRAMLHVIEDLAKSLKRSWIQRLFDSQSSYWKENCVHRTFCEMFNIRQN